MIKKLAEVVSIMFRIILLFLCSALVGCITESASPPTSLAARGPFTEKCPNCGLIFHYNDTFDSRDYSFFSSILGVRKQDLELYYRAPHGPTPSCFSTWTKDTPFLSLTKDLPALRRDTYNSFIERNAEIAQHTITDFRSSVGRTIHIVKQRSDHAPLSLSRLGFSRDGRQALLYRNSSFLLYTRVGNEWEETSASLIWME
jgi:hypothetical protein